MEGLVVGGTRILRPLVLALAARGDRVAVLARGRAALLELEREAGAVPLAVDYRDEAALAAALARLPPLDYAVAYMPHATADARGLVAARTRRVVHVLTSAYLRPGVDADELAAAAPPAAETTTRLLLGRADTRWHTPEEISTAALEALDGSAADHVLGSPVHELE